MKYNSLWGYSDAAGLTEPKLIFGLGQDDKIFAAIDDADKRHKFPVGFKRLALVSADRVARECEFISDEVRAFHESAFDRNQANLKKQKAQDQARRDMQSNFGKAKKIYDDASKDRNAAVSAAASSQDALALKFADDKDRQRAIDNAKDKKDKAAASAEKFSKILESWKVVNNSRSSDDEKNSAFIKLGITKPEPISQP